MRKQNCPACNALKHDVKSRRAFEHIGCEFDRHTIALTSVKGSAAFIGKPDAESIKAVNQMAEIAFKKLKKQSNERN